MGAIDTGLLIQGLLEKDKWTKALNEYIHYFQFMRWHKESFGAIVQKNVKSITRNFENIGTAMSSKLIELRKSPSPALVEQILKLEDFKDIKQHIVSTTVTESQMTIKYLKNVSAMLAVVSAVTEVDLDHMLGTICISMYI